MHTPHWQGGVDGRNIMMKKLLGLLLCVVCALGITSCSMHKELNLEGLLEFEKQYLEENNIDANDIISTYTGDDMRMILLRDDDNEDKLKLIYFEYKYDKYAANEIITDDFYGSLCVTFPMETCVIVFYDSDDVDRFNFNLKKSDQSWIQINETNLQERQQQIFYYKFNRDYQIMLSLEFQ